MIYRNPKIVVKDFLIEWKLGIRESYLEFDGFRLGWGSLIGVPIA